MFVNKATSENNNKSSQVSSKRENFRKQIRKQNLLALFAQKRKELVKSVQYDHYDEQLNNLLKQLRNCKSNFQAQNVLELIFKILKDQRRDIEKLVNIFGCQLVGLFNRFPNHPCSLQILYLTIKHAYENTYQQDNQKYISRHPQHTITLNLQRSQMSVFQLSVDILMKVTDGAVRLLGNRSALQGCDQFQYNQRAIHNLKIQNQLKLCLSCIKELAVNNYMFISRQTYLKTYATQWIKLLMLRHKFVPLDSLIYLYALSLHHVIFESYQVNKNCSVETQNDQQQLVKMMIQQSKRIDNQLDVRKSLMMLYTVQNIIQNRQTRIQKLIYHIEQILSLIQFVFMQQQNYLQRSISRQYDFLQQIIVRFTLQLQNPNIQPTTQQLLRQTPLLDKLKSHSFLALFQFNLSSSNQYICSLIFSLLNVIIKYALAYEIDLEDIFKGNFLINLIVQGVDNANQFILDKNLTSIQYICRFAQSHHKIHYFIDFIRFGLDSTLQALTYFKKATIVNMANNILQTYFSPQKLYQYTQTKNEVQQLKILSQ